MKLGVFYLYPVPNVNGRPPFTRQACIAYTDPDLAGGDGVPLPASVTPPMQGNQIRREGRPMLATPNEKEFRDKTAVAGVGYSRSPGVPGGFTRRSGMSVRTLAVRAAIDACNDAGLDPKELDGAVCYGLQDTVWPREVLSALGVKNINWNCMLEGGGNCSTLCYLTAAEAVHHGICNYVLAYRAMNGRTGVRMGHSGGWASQVGTGQRVGGPSQFISVYGLAGAPHQFAMQARRWMDL